MPANKENNLNGLTDLQISNRHQIQSFLSGLCPEYRLFAIRGKRKAFDTYDEFYSDIISEPFVLSDNKKQVKLGLVYSAVSEVIQYIEDLFSLAYTAKDEENMMKKIVNYNATKIKPYIQSFGSMAINNILNEFHIPIFPNNEAWQREDVQEYYNNSIAIMKTHIDSIVAFYNRFYRFYIQYKHGLKIPLNYMGNREQVEIKSDYIPLSYYETKTIEKVWKEGQTKALMIPSFSPNLRGLGDLYKSENLLRYEYDHISFDEIETVAYQVWQLLNCLQSNLITVTMLEPEEFIEIRFSTNDNMHPFITIGFPVSE